MKKTLVALAVAAVAATSANAAVVYNQDGSKVEVNGSLRVLLQKATDERTDLVNDGSRLIFKVGQDLGNGLGALGVTELRFGSQNNTQNSFTDPTTKKLYLGLSQDGVGTLTFGRQTLSGDDVGVADYAYAWGGNTSDNLVGEDNKVVKFKSADFNGFSFGLDYAFGNRDKSVDAESTYGVSLFYTTALSQDLTLNANAGYQQVKDGNAKTNQWRLAAELESGVFAFGYNYGQSKNKATDVKTAFHLLGAKFNASDVSTVYAQWASEKATGDKRENKYILGADYKLHKNVVTFAEYARVKHYDSENAFGVGLRVHF